MTTVTDPTQNGTLPETLERILKGLTEIWRQLQELKQTQRLGFGPAPYTRTVQCKRREDVPSWYFWRGELGAEPCPDESVTGYALDLQVKEGTYKERPTYNLQLLLDCGDRSFILDSGFKPGAESMFSKGLLLGLCDISAHELKRHPITVAARPGDDEKVLLASVHINGRRAGGEYQDNTNYQALLAQAIATIQRSRQ